MSYSGCVHSPDQLIPEFLIYIYMRVPCQGVPGLQGTPGAGELVLWVCLLRPTPVMCCITLRLIAAAVSTVLLRPVYPPPPPGLGVQTNPYAVCEIDMGPFNRNFPRLNMANYIGQGVTFLNRHLSSSMFQVGPVNRGGGGGEEGGRDAAGCDLAPSWTCCYSSPLDWFTLFGEGLEGE